MTVENATEPHDFFPTKKTFLGGTKKLRFCFCFGCKRYRSYVLLLTCTFQGACYRLRVHQIQVGSVVGTNVVWEPWRDTSRLPPSAGFSSDAIQFAANRTFFFLKIFLSTSFKTGEVETPFLRAQQATLESVEISNASTPASAPWRIAVSIASNSLRFIEHCDKHSGQLHA